MSTWKKVSKINQKRHRERHQPSNRASFGLLEKHKDYVKRAKDFHKKEKVLKKLREKALNKNPDEYYHHMVNSELRNDMHIEKRKPPSENTYEQKLIIENKNINYVNLKLNVETKKLEKLQASLHLVNLPKKKSKDKNINLEQNEKSLKLSHIDKRTLAKAHALKEKQYKELLKRIERKKQLMIIKQKMEVQHNLKKCSIRPKLVAEGSKTSAPVYEWKYERKR